MSMRDDTPCRCDLPLTSHNLVQGLMMIPIQGCLSGLTASSIAQIHLSLLVPARYDRVRLNDSINKNRFVFLKNAHVILKP